MTCLRVTHGHFALATAFTSPGWDIKYSLNSGPIINIMTTCTQMRICITKKRSRLTTKPTFPYIILPMHIRLSTLCHNRRRSRRACDTLSVSRRQVDFSCIRTRNSPAKVRFATRRTQIERVDRPGKRCHVVIERRCRVVVLWVCVKIVDACLF